MTSKRKLAISMTVLVTLAVTCDSLWFVYSPEHWLRRIDFGTVLLDDRPVRADLYFGDPRQSEAETVALVRVLGVGDYFLDFGDVSFREASKQRFLGFPGGVWSVKPMTAGHFNEPLPPNNLNEFRVPSLNGHIVTVQFENPPQSLTHP